MEKENPINNGFQLFTQVSVLPKYFFYILGGLASSLSRAKWLEDPVSSQVPFHLFDEHFIFFKWLCRYFVCFVNLKA